DGHEPLRVDVQAYSQHYLEAKARAGHTVAPTDRVDPAILPEPVVACMPAPLPNAPRFVHLATYLLPVRVAGWFRLHAYVDTVARRERVVLTHGAGGDDATVRLQRETLLDRFPLRMPRFRRDWDEAACRIVAHGRGIVVFADAADDVGDVVPPLVRAH